MTDAPRIPIIYVPSEYTTDMLTSNDTPSGFLTFIRPFLPWYRMFPGEEMNELVQAVNELIARLDLQLIQRIITDPGDVMVELGDYQIVLNKTVPQATNVFLPSVVDWVDGGYNSTPITIKDLAQNAGTNNITITPDGTDTIDKMLSWTIVADGGAVSLRALNDKTGWYVA